MGYENLQRLTFPAGPAASNQYLNPDGSAAVVLTVLPAANEKWWVYGAGAHWTVAVTANGFNTTAPVFSVSKDAANGGSPSEKGTLTLALNTSRAIGEEDMFTDFQPFLVDGNAGDALEFAVKTQGAGATTTGDAIPFVYAKVETAYDGA